MACLEVRPLLAAWRKTWLRDLFRPLAPLSLLLGAPAACEELISHETASCKQDRLKSWQERWAANRTSWHLEQVNPHLKRHLKELIDPKICVAGGLGPRVLVPLCGKSVDMVFLAQKGYRVVGVEGVRQAVEEFAKDRMRSRR